MVKFVKILLVLSWMTLIFATSTISFPDIDPEKKLTLYDYIFDKDVHIILYGVLAFLIISFLYQYPIKFRNAFYIAVLITIIYGISDEYHQTFVGGREASIYDLLFDLIGGIIGTGVYCIWVDMKEKSYKMKKYAQYIHLRIR